MNAYHMVSLMPVTKQNFHHLTPYAFVFSLLLFYPLPVFAQEPAPSTTEQAATPSAPPAPSTQAQDIYGSSRNKLLQIRTLVDNTGQQSSLGSGFLVDPQGYAITNYHVVSDYVLQPDTYTLQYMTTDGQQGKADLLAIDIVNDLAVIKIDKLDQSFFTFSNETLAGKSFKGERVYAMGNPMNIGFAIVEGTYNGLVEHSYNNRIHFTGAINSGMSGGPAVTSEGQVIGINVSKFVNKDLISFLVPAEHAIRLLEQAKNNPPLDIKQARRSVNDQIIAWQSKLYEELKQKGFTTSKFSRYQAPKSEAPWFDCWSKTNANDKPAPLARESTTHCDLDGQMFIQDNLRTGAVRISHTHTSSLSLNDFQFASFTQKYYYPMPLGNDSGKHVTRRFCVEENIAPKDPTTQPPSHVVWCQQAYRDFEDLYDVYVLAITQDQNREALISRLSMKGVQHDKASEYASAFLGAIQWVK